MELFDDRIEALSYFDPLTGEVLRKVPRLTVYRSTHYVTPKERVQKAVEEIPRRIAHAAARAAWRKQIGRGPEAAAAHAVSISK